MISAKEAKDLTNKAKILPSVLNLIDREIRKTANNRYTVIRLISEKGREEIDKRNNEGRTSITPSLFTTIKDIDNVDVFELISVLRSLKYKTNKKESVIKTHGCKEYAYSDLVLNYVEISWEEEIK